MQKPQNPEPIIGIIVAPGCLMFFARVQYKCGHLCIQIYKHAHMLLCLTNWFSNANAENDQMPEPLQSQMRKKADHEPSIRADFLERGYYDL